jgi:uncharacterized protein (TIGR02145 family)
MILFFDTETTGLPKNWKAPVTDLDNWPRLVQLAYLVYDFDGNLIHSCNEMIKPSGFKIPTEASNVHGITTEMASQRGTDINDVFELFLIHLKRSKIIVAHNMAFDEKIIGSELIRLGKENIIVAKEKVCTMLNTVDLCKIDGPYGYKWPKLEELHRFLFNHDFEGAHDALADIQATARCFWELKKIGVIHFHSNNIAPISKSLMEKLKKALMVAESKNIGEYSVEIGGQIWTQRNLDVDCFRNGDLIQEARSNEDWQKAADEEKPAWCYYDNAPANGEKYGKLYNWYAVNDPRGLAPEGWSIPTKEEWEILRDELGDYYITKIIDCAEWLDCPDWIENSDVINDSGFSGLPGGGRLANGVFYNNKREYRNILVDNIFTRPRLDRNELGKDATWWTSSDCFHYEWPRETYKKMAKCFMISDIDIFLGLFNDKEKGKGFSVRCVKPKKYNNEEFLRIHGKIWMKNNLNVERFRNGDKIFEAKTDEEWKKAGELGIPAWCYYKNDNDIGRRNGKLYNWFAVNDPRGLAPEGWRVPSKQDWLDLESFYDWRWEHDDDPQFHPTWILWKEMRINTEGYRGPVDFDTDAIGYCLWWTSTIMENDDSSAYMYNYEPYWSISLSNTFLTCGIYVRCIEDI